MMNFLGFNFLLLAKELKGRDAGLNFIFKVFIFSKAIEETSSNVNCASVRRIIAGESGFEPTTFS